MSTTPKNDAEKAGDAATPKYSEEMPATPEQRERALPGFIHDVADEQKGPDPRDAETPYGGGSFNGTDDSSRYSTPPAKKG